MLMTVMAFTMLFTGCKPNDGPNDDDGAKVVATLKQADIIQAAKAAYNIWVDTPEIPTEITVGATTLTQPQCIYALAKVIVDIEAGNKGDVKVLSYKMADYPDRDSYDQLEIAVFNGPANGTETEDLGNIAKRMIAAMADKGQVPNQILFERGGGKIAFSTNRATICFLRALSEYTTVMPATVSTDYLSTSATLKGFASQFVHYLEIWENTVAESLSADGSHCSGNGTAWENVHFVPIPYSGGYPDGEDQYHTKYQPYHNIEVAGVTYTAAQCWGIALKGILDLVTKEGSTVWATERNPATPSHTLGNGKSLNSPIPTLEEWFIWGKYPWYEKADEGGVVKKGGVEVTEVDVAFLVRVFPWHLTRSSQLGMIGNFQVFGEDPAGSLIYEDYLGIIASMREFLVAARFYKYLLDNNITENVYDAVKNVKFSYDLYNQEQAALALDTETLDFDHAGGTGTVKVITKNETWTATVAGEGVTVNPTQGPAGETSVTVTMAKNEGNMRSATVTFAVPSGKSKVLTVNQAAAPAPANLKDFATQFVHYLEIWENTVAESLSADGSHCSSNGTAWTNVRFIPIPYSGGYPDGEDQYHTKYQPYHNIELDGITYTAAQCWGIALKGVLDLVTTEGSTHWAEARNPASHTLGNGKSFNTSLPVVETWFKWGKYPWYENANDGGPVKKGGVALTEVDVAYMVRLFPWHLKRSSQLGAIGNFQVFGTNPASSLVYEDYEGIVCPIREFLIAARFYKYLLDNNITENVYDAVKDVKFAYDLY